MASTEFLPYDASDLPPAIVRYLDAKDDTRNRESVLDAFAPGARVTDEGILYEGLDAVHGWLTSVATEYTYTTTLTGQRSDGPGQWTVRARLQGDFPGGVADLLFRFAAGDEGITELVIAP